MKLNTANRAFAALVAVSVATYLLLGLAALLLIAAATYYGIWGPGGPRGVGEEIRAGLVFLILIAAGALLGTFSLHRQIRATRELTRRVRELKVPAPPEIVLAASRSRMRRRIDVVSADEPFSFAYGMLWPRVVVSDALCAALTQQELEAVLEHERYHVRNLDPLKVLVARVLPAALFFLPALQDLKRRYVAGRELAADRRALEWSSRPALAGALYKVVNGPVWSELGAAAAIGSGPDLLDARVTQLETGQEPQMPRIRRFTALATTIGVGVLVFSFAAALRELAGPIGALAHDVIVPHISPRPADIAGAVARMVFWTWIGVFVYRRMRTARRPRPLDTTSS